MRTLQKQLAGIVVGFVPFLSPVVEASTVRLDVSTATAGRPWIYFSARTDGAAMWYPKELPAPGPLTDLMTGGNSIQAFVEYDTAALPASSTYEQNTYPARFGVSITGDRESRSTFDSSAALIEELGDSYTQSISAVGKDNSEALDIALPTPSSHEIEYSSVLLAFDGAPQSVSIVRLRVSYDRLILDRVAFGIDLPAGDSRWDGHAPTLSALSDDPAYAPYLNFRWIADARFELLDTGFSSAEDFAAMEAWIATRFTTPRV